MQLSADDIRRRDMKHPVYAFWYAWYRVTGVLRDWTDGQDLTTPESDVD